ncbi:DUF397 domain-containing protein [Nocardiopsis sp. NPDC006832]|uniref:DUF397 domain-containing protein n=1 Tax=Nocardiopsis sp. NPDC006832 TaxID=3157188 RepID=UPI0033F3528E
MRTHTEELTFHKSSYSTTAQECVEVACFRKSSYGGSGDNCVEVADLPVGAAVRDTQNRHLGHLYFGNSHEWQALLAVARSSGQ